MVEDHHCQRGHVDSSPTHLALYLWKAPSFEWFPGCEWWDRVFQGDEPIDTLSCSVGTDVNQLSQQAVEHAEREHVRFSRLSPEEMQRERDGMEKLHRAVTSAEEASRAEACEEDAAIEQVPERAAMLESLRTEFPHISFSAK
jgi:hypothetical protein